MHGQFAYLNMAKYLLLYGAEAFLPESTHSDLDDGCCSLLLFLMEAVKNKYLIFENKSVADAIKRNIDSCIQLNIIDLKKRNDILFKLMSPEQYLFNSFKTIFPLVTEPTLPTNESDLMHSNLMLMERAAAKGDIRVMKYLQQEFKVPVTVVNEDSGCNPLDYAIKSNKDKATAYLLSLGVRPHKMSFLELTKVHELKQSIINDVMEYNQTPISLFSLAKKAVFTKYSISELDQKLPKCLIHQIK